MSQRQLDEQIRRAFSGLTRPPRPQLSDRIRDSLGGRRRPATSPLALPPALAALVAALLVVAVVAAVLVGPAALRTAVSLGEGLNAGVVSLLTPPRNASTPAGEPTVTDGASPGVAASPAASATPTPATSETPAPAPTPPPATPPVATLPGYSCAAQSGGAGQSTMTTARVGAQNGYDRFVVQFAGPVPPYEVTPQDSATFVQGGGPVTLRGAAGLAVVLRNATGGAGYAGPSDAKPGFPEIQEVRLLSDSQGVVEWGVGIAHPACFHAWTLGSPSRLVVDIAT